MAVLREGQTCWTIASATRAAVLVDAAAYYAALVSSWERAERSIVMVGWDFNSRVRLEREGTGDDGPREFAALLDALVRRRPDLEVYVLGWDFAMIYALEREALPLLRMGLTTHGRVHFRLDDRHPTGGSQHQKVVVVDDRVAFVGGIDITACRWDTPEHAPDDPRREDEGFGRYDPFHDVQMVVEGEVAARLGDLVRDRWARAVGRTLEPPDRAGDVWPEGVEADFHDVRVGVARTLPDPAGGDGIREVEAQYEAAFRAARRAIYVENQYLSATRLVRVLVERLGERDGPDVVIVLPRSSGGWLEEVTMGIRRARLVRELREADHGERLRVLHPRVPDVSDDAFTVHAKVLIVDDDLLRVGSANLSNRSMGLDSECDLTIEADGSEPVREAIRAVRARLLGEHLGVSADRVAARLADSPSFVSAIDAMRGEGRTLVDLPIPEESARGLDRTLARAEMLDPERPMPFEAWLHAQDTSEPARAARHTARRLAAASAALLLFWLAERWSDPGDVLGPARIDAWQQALGASALTGPAAAALAFACSLALVPLTLIGLIYGVLLPPGTAVWALAVGAAASVPVGYGLGQSLLRDTVRTLAGRHLNRLARDLEGAGPLSIALLRQASRSAFGVVNLVAGASRIPLRPLWTGTLLGLVPGALLLVGWTHLAWWLTASSRGLPAVVAIAAFALWAASWLRGRRIERATQRSGD